jgi:hypothetical protein
MNTRVPLHFLIILLLVISIASTSIPRVSAFEPGHEVSWSIGYDEEIGKFQFSLQHDAAARKAYVVGLVEAGEPLTADQTAFDDDLYFDLYADFWVFAETTAGLTVFHLWLEGDVLKMTVNGISQKDFDIKEARKLPEKPSVTIA